MRLDTLPPSHPQPGSKNKGRCVIKCYQSAIKPGENLRSYRVFRVLNREKQGISGFSLLPLFFGVLLWLIYALNIILNGNFEPVFLPIISFIKIFVAEKVANSLAG